ncbi:MAG TPA: GTPase HflX [Thermoanaerobaculia bacterium]|nr:GTPase HflX [Thermoanaerobaculia bacterium]
MIDAMKAPAREKAVLVGIASRGVPRAVAEEHLDELERLLDTAGGVEVARFVKERSAPDPATFVGKGAVEEIGAAAADERAKLVVFDEELTPAQTRNLERQWDGVRVLDRPGLILEVFASHARTREARTQVELARLQYLLPRLAGRYERLSGLRGGIGARGGAGEQKLELDRRRIRDRIARLRRDLEKIETAREVRRRGRKDRYHVAIAGYTNAGKTTLFNRLTQAREYAADRLFATLDSRAAHGVSPALRDVVFLDTVGFVRKLPPGLVASFRSTLAEIRDADLVLQVLDASSPRVDEERRVASEVLAELGVPEEKILAVWNKRDLPGALGPAGAVRVSAATGAGIGDLERAIALRARPETARMRLAIPYADGRAISAVRARCRVIAEEDRGDALVLTVAGERARLGALSRYLVGEARDAAAAGV